MRIKYLGPSGSRSFPIFGVVARGKESKEADLPDTEWGAFYLKSLKASDNIEVIEEKAEPKPKKKKGAEA